MDIEFDLIEIEKAQAERGFGFASVAPVFVGRVIEVIDGLRDHGEVRVKAIGELGGQRCTGSIDTGVPGSRRITSARDANGEAGAAWLSSQ